MKPSTFSVFAITVVLTCVQFIPQNTFADNDLPPNIVLILTDDQSWAGTTVLMDSAVSDSKGEGYVTPAVERLAREGMKFSAGYAAAPVCSPSRYAIQFGQTPARIGVTFVNDNKGNVDHESPDTLAELIKRHDKRYVTAHIGKWHIDAEPSVLGFDESDGRTSNREGGVEYKKEYQVKITKDPKLTHTLMERANDFMTRQTAEKKPFFLQISHYANHTWIAADPEDIAKYKAVPQKKRVRHPAYSAMTEALDRSVGGVLDKIDELEIADRTYVILTSDNGAIPSFPPVLKPKNNLNGPLRGGKWATYEGGIRVPLIIRGPEIAAGSQCDAPVSGVDFLPTILEMAGAQNLETKQTLDGLSFYPILKNGNTAADCSAFEERAMIWHYPKMGKWKMLHPASTIRKNGWKLIVSLRDEKKQLYRISEDHSESKDLIESEPEKAKELHDELLAYLRGVNQQ